MSGEIVKTDSGNTSKILVVVRRKRDHIVQLIGLDGVDFEYTGSAKDQKVV